MEYPIPWADTVSYSGMVGSVPQQTDHPIVFVHGNSRDETDWTKHFTYLQENGFEGRDLWAIGFDTSSLTHGALAEQLEDFVTKMLDITKADQLSIVGHSLGVTVNRYWMHKYDRYDSVSVFIGLAGANHGLDACGMMKVSKYLPASHKYKPCQSLGRSVFFQTPIEELNEKVGETPGNVRYYTIRGSKDNFYTGCIDSPILNGAEENVLLETDHDGVRESDESLRLIEAWLSNRDTAVEQRNA